jgi:hypothetical protein
MNVNGSHLLERFWVFGFLGFFGWLVFVLFCLFVHGFKKSGIRVEKGIGVLFLCAALFLCQPLGATTTLVLFLFICFCSSSYAVWLLRQTRS